MSKVQDTGPLDWRIAIVTNDGRPTPEFQRRWATQRTNNTQIGSITLGNGVPSTVPDDGAEYVDISTTPYTVYIGNGGIWHKSSVTKFPELSDVPHSYTSFGANLVRVNAGATGLEFVTTSAALDGIGASQGDLLYRSSTAWTVLAPGTSGQFLKTQGTGADPVWAPLTVPVGANPTATASDTAVNGTAITFMRSDAAPAVQLGSGSQFGIVKVDGTSITASGGVISSVGGGSGTGDTLDKTMFGDGSDGTLSISSGTTTLTRVMYYYNLTVSGTAILRTASAGNRTFRIFVAGTLDISGAQTGAIQALIADGAVANALGNGGAITFAGTIGTVAAQQNGQAGANGGVGAGVQGTAAGAANGIGPPCGASGASGLGSGGAGAASRPSVAATLSTDVRRLTQMLAEWNIGNFSLVSCGIGGPGGASGGGDGTQNGGGGGGGGPSGAILYIAARTINRGAGTAVGAISARGGNGGSGGTTAAGTNTGGGGGGGGGSGGWLYLVYRTLTGTTATNALDASGGSGGAGGNGKGTGVGGDGGGAGGGGRIDVYNLGLGTQNDYQYYRCSRW